MGSMRLNKYLAHACQLTRREATEAIKKGIVKVNSLVVIDPAYELQDQDTVYYKERLALLQVPKHYYVINKAKRTGILSNKSISDLNVQDIMQKKGLPILQPLDDLGQSHCGLLVMTNDEELLQKMSQTNFNCKKIYQIECNLLPVDTIENKISTIVKNNQSIIASLALVETRGDKMVLGLESNRGEVKQVIEALQSQGILIDKMDRNLFGSITKKDLKRNWFRMLTEKEIIFLKYFQ